MMNTQNPDLPNNETREAILKVAEELFSKRGYAAVKLRDIAAAVGMRHASLYYYAPGGKEDLFVEVMQRSFQRHRTGMAQAIRAAGPALPDQMQAVAEWIVSQPPMDLARMTNADLPAIDPQKAAELSKLALDAMTIPIIEALQAAAVRGAITPMPNYGMAAMAFTVLLQSTHQIPEEAVQREIPGGRKAIGQTLVNMLLYGWLPRQ
ncbi:MAG: TetR/AcrR family transcriptional regulator [Caldilineaceae bacterium]